MAGKTGTSQVRNISAAERASGVVTNDQLPWNRRDHALFVGFAPFDAPRYRRARSSSNMAAAGRPPRRRSRATSCCARCSDGVPPLDAYPSSQRDRIETHAENCSCGPGRGRFDRPEPRLRRAAMSFLEYQRQDGPDRDPQGPVPELAARSAACRRRVGRVPDALFDRGRQHRPLGRAADEAVRRRLVLMLVIALVPIWFWRNMAGVAYADLVPAAAGGRVLRRGRHGRAALDRPRARSGCSRPR